MRSLLLALVLSFTVSSMAFAHVRLVVSTPAKGEVLEVAPAKIELVFSEAAKIISIKVVSAEGEEFATSALPKELVDEVSVTVAALKSGKYVIHWRGASKDMHAMSGKIEFSIN